MWQMPFLSKEMAESVRNEIVLHPPDCNARCAVRELGKAIQRPNSIRTRIIAIWYDRCWNLQRYNKPENWTQLAARLGGRWGKEEYVFSFLRTFLSKQKMPMMKKTDVPCCCQKREQRRRRWICFSFDQVLLLFDRFPTFNPSPSLLHIFFFLFSFFSPWCWLQQNPATCWWWWWWWWRWSTCRPPPDKEHSGKTNSEDGHLNILLTYWWICETFHSYQSAHIKIKI